MKENEFETICPLLVAAAIIAGERNAGRCLKGKCELWDPVYGRCTFTHIGDTA